MGRAERTDRPGFRALRRWTAGLLCLLYFSPALPSGPALQGERLEYRISYQGALSAMARIDICDAVLETSLEQGPSGEPAYRSTVRISSEGHEQMERLYPFRYRLRSFYSADLQHSILLDKYRKTRKERHEIVWFDWERKVAERYKRRKPKEAPRHVPGAGSGADGRKDEGMLRILSGLGYDPANFRPSSKTGLRLPGLLLDRLSLLQAARSRDFSPGQEIRLSVSDGKAILNYRVQVLGREPIGHGGRMRDSFKLRFDAFADGRWSGRTAHPGVFVWLTADGSKTPVRFSVDYALGTFVVQMKEGRDIQASVAQGGVTPSLPDQLSSAR